MINPFTIKKWSALLFTGLFTVIAFYIGLMYNFMIALGTMFGGLLMCLVIGNLLLKNPFTSMLEGKGVLVCNIDSTGIFRFFILSLRSPYVQGRLAGRRVEDVWDRSTVVQIAAPKVNGNYSFFDRLKKKTPPKQNYTYEKIMEGEKRGGLRIEISEEEYNDSRFALFHYPLLMWNDQMKCLLTKEWIAKNEKETFAEHGILYLNRKMEELTGLMRDFARLVVDQATKPRGSIFANKWFWIIMVIIMGIIGIMFLPSIINNMQSFWGQGGNALAGATNTITPR